MPEAGGSMDQPSWWRDVMTEMQVEQAKIDNEAAKKSKQERTRNKPRGRTVQRRTRRTPRR